MAQKRFLFITLISFFVVLFAIACASAERSTEIAKPTPTIARSTETATFVPTPTHPSTAINSYTKETTPPLSLPLSTLMPSGDYLVYRDYQNNQNKLGIISIDGKLKREFSIDGEVVGISKDGKLLAYINGIPAQLFIWEIDKQIKKPISFGCIDLSWSPTKEKFIARCGESIIFFRQEGTSLHRDTILASTAPPAGVGLHYQDPPKWSPNGKWIAYLRTNQATASFQVKPFSEIFIFETPCLDLQILFCADKPVLLSETRGVYDWSPDSRYLVIASDSGTGKDYDVSIVDIFDRRIVKKILNPEQSINSIAWSPDGKWIAYSQYKQENILLLSVLDGKIVSLEGTHHDKILSWITIP